MLLEGKMVQVRRACRTQPVLWKWLCSLGDIAKEGQTSCEALTFHNNVKPGKNNTQGNLGWEGIFFNIWWSTCSNSGSTESAVSSRALLHYSMKPCCYCCSEETEPMERWRAETFRARRLFQGRGGQRSKVPNLSHSSSPDPRPLFHLR